MKKILILLATAAAAVCLVASCDRNEPVAPETPAGDLIKTNIVLKARTAEAPESKTHIVATDDAETGTSTYTSHWDATGESLGLLLFKGSLTSANVPVELPGEDSEGSILFHKSDVSAEAGVNNMFLFYPYSAYDSTGDGYLVANLKSSQSPVLGSFDPSCDVMGYSTNNVNVVEGQDVVIDNITLQRPMAIVRLRLNADANDKAYGEKVTSVKMALSIPMPLTGKFKVTTTGNVDIVTPATYVEATYDLATGITIGDADKKSVYLVTLPVTIPAGTDITFTIGTENFSGDDAIVRTVTAESNMALQGGKVNVIDVMLRDKIVLAHRYAGGTGAEGDPWLIATPEHLIHMSQDLSSGRTRYFKMIEDVDMDGITGWLPGNTEGSFDAAIFFDGNNHTISNLEIAGVSGKKYTSLFGILNGTVKNLNLNNCSNTTGEATPIGLIAGWAGVSGGGFTARIENVHATNCTVSSSYGTNNIGGLVGSANKTDFINCSFDGTVERTANGDGKYRYMGGICGGVPSASNYAYFENCSSSGTLTATTNSMGGILGGMEGNATAELKGCSSTMTINANGGKVIGGIIGYVGGAKLTDCHYDGTITTTNTGVVYAAGVAPYCAHWIELYDCTSKGTLDAGSVGQRVGGISASLETGETDTHDIIVQNCHSTMTLYGGNYTGGLIGYLVNKDWGGNRTITGCSYSGRMDGLSHSAGLIGYAFKATISRCSVSGQIRAGSSGNNPGGGLTGRSDYVTIEDCSFSGKLDAQGQRSAGIIGNAAAGNDIVRRCFVDAELVTRQLNIGGIIGISSGGNSEANFAKQMNITVEKCILWSTTVKAMGGNINQWGSGAIIGAAGKFHTLTDNYRNPDLTLTYNQAWADAGWPILYDQENTSSSVPLLFYDGTSDASASSWAQTHYHGKAAAAGKTASQVASDLGWPTDVWDLTGDTPKLK